MAGSIENADTTDAATNNELVEIADGAGSGNKVTVTAANALKVDGSAVTQPVSGTVDVTQSTSPWIVQDIVNVSGQYRAQSVTTSAAEALGAATILSNRKMISITPTNGTVYWGFSNSVTTTTGTPIFKNQTVTFAVGSSVHVYVISGGTVDCRIAEGS